MAYPTETPGSGPLAPDWGERKPSRAPTPFHEHQHQTNLVMAANDLTRDRRIGAYEAVYELTCECGAPNRNTRLAATIWTLRNTYGWDIQTITKPKMLAEYVLVKAGRHPAEHGAERTIKDEPKRSWFLCTGCGAQSTYAALSSKYGKPQLVGEIKDKRLVEAKCQVCEEKGRRSKGARMQAIWREQ
jgi:hypothetical protein